MRSPRKSAMVWLCLLVYAITGMVRTHGVLLCIGRDHVALATVDAPCACCATKACAQATRGGTDGAAPGGVHQGGAAPCEDCTDVALQGRDDRLPQQPLQKAEPSPPPLDHAVVVSTEFAAPIVVPTIRLAANCRAPPLSSQSPLRLLRTVLLLV